MEKAAFYKFADEHGIKYLEHEELSKHTSFKIGGPAEIFAKPEKTEQVSEIAVFCMENEIPLLPLGKGSNVLISDNGIKGIVMCFGSDFGKSAFLMTKQFTARPGQALPHFVNLPLKMSLPDLSLRTEYRVRSAVLFL